MVFILSSCEKIKYEYLKKIRDINKVTPGIWIIAGRVFQNIKYTLVLNNTFIISVYELNENKLIAVYKVLKELNKTKGIKNNIIYTIFCLIVNKTLSYPSFTASAKTIALKLKKDSYILK